MNDLDYNFILQDRIAKIIDTVINPNEWYIAFSGGRDSLVLHYLIDFALPNNNIKRIYCNTGIEEKEILKFVKEMALKDNRIVIFNVNKNIKTVLQNGFPFKSKKYSMYFNEFLNGKKSSNFKESYDTLFGNYTFLTIGLKKENANINFNCCKELKKDFDFGFSKTITGIRKAEGGLRSDYGKCYSEYKGKVKFNPLFVVNDEWENEFIKRNNIKLCSLYYPPYNFNRTGCVGCPYIPDLQNYLLTMKKNDYPTFKRCWYLWGYVYELYLKLGYRLTSNEVRL